MRTLVVCFLAMVACTAHGEDLQSLMSKCVPDVHPTTMAAIIRVESAGNMFALSDDGPGNLPWSERKNMLRSFKPATLDEAAATTRELLRQGHWVGLGLTQLASRHLSKRGLSVEQALDPCTNLREGGRVLKDFYLDALKTHKEPQAALQAAISAYNTGNFRAGVENGYVAKVVNASRYSVPALTTGRAISAVASGGSRSRAGQLVQQPIRVRRGSAQDARFASLEAESF
ncbi:hypothetical protein R77560_04593 [Ralstonia thomasii]|uniref:Transglycosylase SLT domain-containing protein n=1 Tax=Ralstonia thomasii TaxID=3058596 RepID=A0AAD2BW92_9RALS|nr:lytic transglycosylase domain-containing protein [Ralstonia sp. LMG 18095]CAJ0807565.1 hypothetical protein R77560_04593 [Ralstonia sp. LMG 18095]